MSAELTPAERLLVWLLRLDAAVLLFAAVPVFFPTDWMREVHEWMGLGAFPDSRLTEYLTRSVAACYTMHGVIIGLLSTDVRRYRPLIPAMFVLHLAFAAAMLGIDLYVGMPWWWTATEAGTIGGVAVVVLAVARAAAKSANVR